MFLLQAHKLCLELTVVFVGHRLESIRIVSAPAKPEMVDSCRRCAAAQSRMACHCSARGGPGSTSFLKNYLRFRRLWQVAAAQNTFGNQIRLPLQAAIDSRSKSCTITRPERCQMEVPMAIQAHLAELERKHEALEDQLHDALNHPSTDDITILEIKRRKLQVKDEIERLRTAASDTVH
jgi:hypothetical protein